MSVYDIHCIFEVCEHIRHVYDNVSRMYIYKIAIHHIHGGIRRAYIAYTYAGKGSILTDAQNALKRRLLTKPRGAPTPDINA